MTRKAKILKHIDKNGRGVEIGPGHRPVAPKKKGYNVHIIDHMSREDLVNKYKDHNINVEAIEEVDFIWKGEPYFELTGKRKFYDWIIASHVIEHTPDLIGFLSDCDAILKDDGIISLCVPDKRYCFDHFRPITGISKIIDHHFQKSKIHTPGTVAEYFLNVVSKAENISWNSSTLGEYKFVHSLENALQGMNSILVGDTYIDVHAWCFVPHSFRLMIHDLYCLGLIPFQEVEFYPTEESEFFITISRNGKGIRKSRLEILASIESEIKEEVIPPKTLKSKGKNIIKRLIKGLS
jgi:predicted SAM-dependent methyltransferase